DCHGAPFLFRREAIPSAAARRRRRRTSAKTTRPPSNTMPTTARWTVGPGFAPTKQMAPVTALLVAPAVPDSRVRERGPWWIRRPSPSYDVAAERGEPTGGGGEGRIEDEDERGGSWCEQLVRDAAGQCEAGRTRGETAGAGDE